ncbi:unnamed protein product, partial [Polarella glacialis]
MVESPWTKGLPSKVAANALASSAKQQGFGGSSPSVLLASLVRLAPGGDELAGDIGALLTTEHLGRWRDNPKLATPVLSGLARHRLPDIAVLVLGLMQGSQVELDMYHYSSAITACEKGQKWQRAFDLLAEMKDCGVQRDCVAFSAAVSAAEKQGRWSE